MSSSIKKGGLRVIVPTPITDAVLYASSVLENDYAIWNRVPHMVQLNLAMLKQYGLHAVVPTAKEMNHV